MNKLAMLIGLGVLVGGGVAIASQMSSSVTMKRGGAYSFLVDDEGALTPEILAQWGFASMTMGNEAVLINGHEWVPMQAIWAGEDGLEFTPPKDMRDLTYLGMLGNPNARPTNPPINYIRGLTYNP